MEKHAKTLTYQACFSRVYPCFGFLSGSHYTAFYFFGRCPLAQLHPGIRSHLACPLLQPKGQILALLQRGGLSGGKAVLLLCAQWCVMPLTCRWTGSQTGVTLPHATAVPVVLWQLAQTAPNHAATSWASERDMGVQLIVLSCHSSYTMKGKLLHWGDKKKISGLAGIMGRDSCPRLDC